MDAKFGFYEKNGVRIRYVEIGTGFPLLATPGGGLNSRISNWSTMAAINIMEEFKNDFRVISMDQRNANTGESSGPISVDNPWDAFADDQLGVMDHLGIERFFFFGNCIGGPFAMKLIERAPQRVVAAILSQPVGHKPELTRITCTIPARTSGPRNFSSAVAIYRWRPIEKYLHNLYRVQPDFVYSVSREFAKVVPDADAGTARRRAGASAASRPSTSPRFARTPRSRCFRGRSRRS